MKLPWNIHWLSTILYSPSAVFAVANYNPQLPEKWLCAMPIFPFSAGCVGPALSEEKQCFPVSWAVSPGPDWVQPQPLHLPVEFHRQCPGDLHKGLHHYHHPLSRHIHLEEAAKRRTDERKVKKWLDSVRMERGSAIWKVEENRWKQKTEIWCIWV